MSGNYIVVFKSAVSQDRINALATEVNDNGGEVTRRFDGTILNGFAAKITDNFLTTLESLQENEIDYIEPDGEVTTQ